MQTLVSVENFDLSFLFLVFINLMLIFRVLYPVLSFVLLFVHLFLFFLPVLLVQKDIMYAHIYSFDDFKIISIQLYILLQSFSVYIYLVHFLVVFNLFPFWCRKTLMVLNLKYVCHKIKCLQSS